MKEVEEEWGVVAVKGKMRGGRGREGTGGERGPGRG